VRNAGGKREITNKYNEIRTVPKYSSLPAVRSAEQAEEGTQEMGSRKCGSDI
jgi:hypothetical protein